MANIKQPIKVLVVEDSPVKRELLLHILHTDPAIGEVLIASDGDEAITMACRERPNVITMDVHMPKVDGIQATRSILERCPTPIIIISSSAAYGPEGDKAFLALEAGALALASSPPGLEHPNFAMEAEALRETVKLMAEVRVVRRFPHLRTGTEPTLPEAKPKAPVEVVAIGASAGGPQALRELLSGLPKDFPVPLLIVQHMTPGFIHGFGAWLHGVTGFPVRIATQGERIQSGHAYLAPDGMHMGVTGKGGISLSDVPPDDGVRPSVDHLFRSVGQVYGASAVAVLLSGMGRDGAEAIKALKQRGAITLAQDRDSTMINGMPGEAVRIGGVSHVLPLQQMAGFLTELVQKGIAHG